MKGIVKAVIAGAVIIGIGAAILIGTLAFNGWSVKDPEFEMRSFTATQDNTALDIEIGAGSVVTQFYDGDKIVIDYPFSDECTAQISENNGTLNYKFEIKKFFFWGNRNVPDTVIKLPSNAKFSVKLDMDAGAATLADGEYENITLDMDAGAFNSGTISCNTLNLDMDAGSAKIGQATCSSLVCDMSAGSAKIEKVNCDQSRIKVSAGSTNIGFAGAKEEYSISAKVSAGSCNVDSQSGSTGKSININVSAGSVNLSFAV